MDIQFLPQIFQKTIHLLKAPNRILVPRVHQEVLQEEILKTNQQETLVLVEVLKMKEVVKNKTINNIH